ncbi:DUF4492 domain-containing protein [Campylobacter sp. RM9344]|uniref:DUF4492 domain-containing protein n=1 Tax=Campylobacter californiensis TaxID=1032243 RepID=A0AAW3ZVV1_9BACT|nr:MULTISPECIES: DUF4492 domain-containing protein [unclassified Campylobacter]MBE2985032.1 DUF4492 domain-containing protein [Campylobacter sp. RM6883]MBE2986738.1 DUF4492 domain-containing protein [Campylobacter sp. RM12919]MBE2988468.1 DUF4492 domain-containing protein [Campylobacter sp. RM12920]MBE2995228.1 DUF4492 domain-containing protein [Campylobacter sp. RM6913]MBE3022088.1 DUF4492 domain-containing protein [Campylobacter sp. 7477a]MBE3029515.1 DUF4492 domain-containing protein [Camp
MSKNYLINFFKLYSDGFKNMKLGKRLWAIILIKLLIMFGILKIFFFSETLNTKFQSDDEKANFVIENLTKE